MHLRHLVLVTGLGAVVLAPLGCGGSDAHYQIPTDSQLRPFVAPDEDGEAADGDADERDEGEVPGAEGRGTGAAAPAAPSPATPAPAPAKSKPGKVPVRSGKPASPARYDSGSGSP